MLILKGNTIAAIFAPLWQPELMVDLTKPGSGATKEAQQTLDRAGRAIAGMPVGTVVSLDAYRSRRLKGGFAS